MYQFIYYYNKNIDKFKNKCKENLFYSPHSHNTNQREFRLQFFLETINPRIGFALLQSNDNHKVIFCFSQEIPRVLPQIIWRFGETHIPSGYIYFFF